VDPVRNPKTNAAARTVVGKPGLETPSILAYAASAAKTNDDAHWKLLKSGTLSYPIETSTVRIGPGHRLLVDREQK
jgi:hypothetical protein